MKKNNELKIKSLNIKIYLFYFNYFKRKNEIFINKIISKTVKCLALVILSSLHRFIMIFI